MKPDFFSQNDADRSPSSNYALETTLKQLHPHMEGFFAMEVFRDAFPTGSSKPVYGPVKLSDSGSRN